MAESSPNELQDRRLPQDVVPPPTDLRRIILQIGPGLIIAASIVGSGELIMTTKVGAEAGISLLWLIILGCVVKVFVQLELGRFTISHGETTLTSLNTVPGPRLGRLNWVVILWMIMMVTTIGQLGGIVGGVGQSLAITCPITGDYRDAVLTPSKHDIAEYTSWKKNGVPPELSEEAAAQLVRRIEWIERDLNRLGDKGRRIAELSVAGQELVDEKGIPLVDPPTKDDRNWVIIIGILTSILLFRGQYGLIEKASIALVVIFTMVTVGNVISLQSTERYAISGEEILRGLSFHLPKAQGALLTALAAFGIIGVGAVELIAYPYWCLEKGYARSTGPRDSSDEWLQRARGWFRVMKFDAFASMAVYTAATAAFFFLGAAVLHSDGRNPEDMRMVSTLSEAYVPVFGEYAKWLFLLGAFAVLYSTFLVANAGHARMTADFCGVLGLIGTDSVSPQRLRLVRWLSAALPLICVFVFMYFPRSPVLLISVAGLTQSIMLPILGWSSIWFRYRITDPRLRPGLLWDAALILSSLALLIAGLWGSYQALLKLSR